MFKFGRQDDYDQIFLVFWKHFEKLFSRSLFIKDVIFFRNKIFVFFRVNQICSCLFF